MAKKSTGGLTALLVLALVLPIGAANFVLNLLLTVFYIPAIQNLLVPNPADTLLAGDIEMAMKIFVHFVLCLVGLAFSIIVLTSKAKDPVLSITALILNSIVTVSGLFFIYSTYFAG